MLACKRYLYKFLYTREVGERAVNAAAVRKNIQYKSDVRKVYKTADKSVTSIKMKVHDLRLQLT